MSPKVFSLTGWECRGVISNGNRGWGFSAWKKAWKRLNNGEISADRIVFIFIKQAYVCVLLRKR